RRHTRSKRDWSSDVCSSDLRKKVQEKMSGTTSFTQLMENQGKTPSSKTISYQVTTPSLSEQEHLKLSDHDNILRMERIRYADERSEERRVGKEGRWRRGREH